MKNIPINMLPLSPNLQKALKKAIQLHSSHVRKADKAPYSSHPVSVAWLLTNYTDDEATLCAALLHDVLEDVSGYDYSDMRREFGDEIASIVKDVSEDKDASMPPEEENATWKDRKLKYLEHLKHCHEKALMVSAADKMHNLYDLMNSYQTMGNDVWSKFNASKEESLWFYEEVLKVIQSKLKNKIVGDYGNQFEVAKNTL